MPNSNAQLSEPSSYLGDPADLLREYLDFYREVLLRKFEGLSYEDLRTTRLPSGWSPLGLLKHIAYMERRWLRWGFAGESLPDPWGDSEPDGESWRLDDSDTVQEIRALLMDQRTRTNAIIAANGLGDRASPGGRFATTQECPTLAWILFHVLQEYARHAGHLDIARELIDGSTGG